MRGSDCCPSHPPSGSSGTGPQSTGRGRRRPCQSTECRRRTSPWRKRIRQACGTSGSTDQKSTLLKLQSLRHLVCCLLLEKKTKNQPFNILCNSAHLLIYNFFRC